MATQTNKGSLSLILVVLGLGLLAILTTVYVGLEFSRPAEGQARGFLTWVTIGFLCFVELLLTLMITNGIARRADGGGPSGAAVMIVLRVIILYAVVGTVSIIIYRLVPGRTGDSDRVFTAIMIAELVAAFIVAAVVYSHDRSMRATMAPVLETRQEHAAKARSLQGVLGALGSAPLTGDAVRLRREALTKMLQNLSAALAHSHGGGIGSREAGHRHPVDPAAEQTLDAALGEMTRISMEMISADAESAEQKLAALERLAAQVQVSVDALELA